MTALVQPPRRAAFLDRDGVLSRAIVRDGVPYAPTSLDEFELYPDAPAACSVLRSLGFAPVVVTNQPDIARGRLDSKLLESMNDRLASEVPVDAVYVCPHDDSDRCDCRKPEPGLLLRAAAELRLELARSVMIGDRWRDVAAGRRAGCLTVLIDRGYQEDRYEEPDVVAAGLSEAVRWIEELVASEGVASG